MALSFIHFGNDPVERARVPALLFDVVFSSAVSAGHSQKPGESGPDVEPADMAGNKSGCAPVAGFGIGWFEPGRRVWARGSDDFQATFQGERSRAPARDSC